MRDWSDIEGSPAPPGPSYCSEHLAWNFSLASRRATGVTLLIYGRESTSVPMLERALDPIRNRTGPWWHCRVPAREIPDALYYAYRVEGPAKSNSGRHRYAFDPDKVLLDPYAPAVFFPSAFDRKAAIAPGPNDGRAPLGVLPRTRDPFSWDRDRRPSHGPADLIIYELHVRGFTRHASSGLTESKRGTFAGLIDKIPYLTSLGITAVELMPVFQFDPQEGNYWGYMPLSFFAVHSSYAVDAELTGPFAAKDEFRAMVKAMHRAGIEVLIDAVHNHTAEGDLQHPTYSLKGIDYDSYYVVGDNPEDPYRNFSGTGNSLNGNNPEARRLVIDSMRYWIDEMHVDGFRHDLASVVMRSSDGGFRAEPHAAVATMAVRELDAVRHIVEPWDAAGGYLLGKAFPIPSAWQWNGAYRDTMRRFVRGDAGLVGAAMQRLYGSDDLFPDAGPLVYRPAQSVNFITSHDGFTLYDLLAYTRKHNDDNGHDNRDGPDEDSSNCGHEGDGPDVPQPVLALRARQAKNFCAILLLSNGTPMLRAGDEFLQTQGGNNNPYNQDSATTWLDWSRLYTHRDVWRFFRAMIAFRKAHPSIARPRFWREDVRWFGPGGPVDFSPESRSFAFHLLGEQCLDDDLFAAFNMGDRPATFTPPSPGGWLRVIDTARASPDDVLEPESERPIDAESVRVEPRSVVVLVRRRRGASGSGGSL